MPRKTLVVVAALAISAVLVSACTKDSLRSDQNQTDTQLLQYQSVQPVPFFNWSQDRAVLTQIYEAKNQARQTWSVIYSAAGAPIFLCPSVGYPIPANTQLTNPEQWVGSGGAVVPQMEPNGLYSTTGANGTYVLCARSSGKLAAVYSESWVTAYPFEVKIENGQVVDLGGDSTINIDVNAPAGVPTTTPAP